FVLELATAQSSKATKGHVEDVVRLLLGEVERRGHQRDARGTAVVRTADSRDDEVQHVDGLQQTFDDVRASLGLAESELRASREDFDLVRDVVRQRLGEIERARYAIDERQHVDCEGSLQRRV